jgi:hypothetical protein
MQIRQANIILEGTLFSEIPFSDNEVRLIYDDVEDLTQLLSLFPPRIHGAQ